MEIDSTQSQEYDESNIDFLTGFANFLAEAVDTSGRLAALFASLNPD